MTAYLEYSLDKLDSIAGNAIKYLQAHPILRSFVILYSLVFVYIFSKIIYNLYFHPLAKFPGPRLAAATDLWFGYIGITGHQYKILREWHKKYGTTLRIAPNELSFSSVTALSEVYGRPSKGRKLFPKSKFWKPVGLGFKEAGIATEIDVEKHRRKRQYLQPLVSLKNVRKYDPIIQNNVNKFLVQLEKEGGRSEGSDLVALFHHISFDITADLLFGEPFGAVESGTPHEWVKMIVENVDIASYQQTLERIPLAKWFLEKLIPPHLVEARTYHVRETTKKVRERIYAPQDPNRIDIMTHLIKIHESGAMDLDEISSHVCQIIIGGSETVATTCTFFIYHLLSNPRVKSRVEEEIRAFDHIEEISGPSTQHLTWFNAAIKETLRIHSPGPTGLPRESPGETVDGDYIPAGTSVFVHPWTISRSQKYFHQPDTFLPERWIEKNDDVKEAWAAFGLGSRQCLAVDMAWDELRRILGGMIFLFDMSFVDPKEDWESKNRAYLLWKKAPLRVHTQRRTGV